MSNVGRIEFAPNYGRTTNHNNVCRSFIESNIAAYPARLLDELRQLALRQHYYVDADCYYSCPVRNEACGPETDIICTCGPDEHNKKVEQLYQQLKQA